MPASTKWPDFRLASTLWSSFMGSQSSLPEKPSSITAASSSQPGLAEQPEDELLLHHHDQQQQQHLQKRNYNTQHLEHHSATDTAPGMLTDSQGRPVDGIGGFDEFDQQADGPEADFGALEMFDSNAAEAPGSSQVNGRGQAPEAMMSAEASMPAPKLSKRERKERRRRESQQMSDNAPSAIGEPSARKKNKKSKNKSTNNPEVPDSQPANQPDSEAVDATTGANDEVVIPSSQAKKKRKLSDSADGKRRKKRRSHDPESEDVVQGTQQDGRLHSAAATFLRKAKGKGLENIIFEDDVASSQSPSAARLRRRSHSRDGSSRENSAPLEADADRMEVDAQPEPAIDSDRDLGTEDASGYPVNGTAADNDVESLAREAWNEHQNSRNGTTDVTSGQNEAGDVAMEDSDVRAAAQVTANDGTDGAVQPPGSTPRRPRSTRAKKAKPTYFEQPPPEEDLNAADGNDGLEELPSPSAMTPKPRTRAKRATKKKQKEPKKLSQSMRGGSQENEAEDPPKRRKNRMLGYTQGRFTEEELGRIGRAVESFRSESELSQEEVNEMIQAPGGTTAGDTHAELWARILAECPDRHRQKVINIARKKFHNFVARGTWTTEQDEELTDLIKVHRTQWAKIAAIINRHPEDIRDRYRNYLICGDTQRKDAWDEVEESRLMQYVIEAMEAIDDLRQNDPNPTLLGSTYEELIDWQHLSERMDRTRSRLQCITKWKSMNLRTSGKDKLVSNKPDAQISFGLEKARRQIKEMAETERYRFVMAIESSAAGKDSKIPWQRLCDKQFRTKWHRGTLMLLWRRLRQTVTAWQEKTVRDCAHELAHQYSTTGEMPDVGDEKYDDADEMEYMLNIPVVNTPSKPSGPGKGGRSSEFVNESDQENDENDGAENDIEGEEAVDQEMKIDPALMADTPQQAKKVAKKTSSGKRPTKKGKKAAAAASVPDPIEDEGEAAAEDDEANADGSEIDEGSLRKKKTPIKFKSPGNKSKSRASGAGSASESGMDDMEDLPARIAA